MSTARSVKTAIWVGIAASVALVTGANMHLIYVAARSQPECVPHRRLGDAASVVVGAFSAAASACAPRAVADRAGD